MKAKTRILALLLTVLMVVGMLPLALFALDAEINPAPTITANGKYEKKTLEQIQTEFAGVNMELARFQTFESFDDTLFKSFYNSYGHAQLGKCANSNPNEPAVDTTAYCDYNADDGESFNFVDQKAQSGKGGLSIVTESDGNKALYYGKPEKSGSEGKENYISMTGFGPGGERLQDIYASFDIKMEGDKMAPVALINLVYRTSGPHYIKPLYVAENGELYIGSRSNVVGKLSKDEYTRIAIATDRVNNKVYIYINDVLANPGGDVFFSESDVKTYNEYHKTSYSANVIHLSDIRVYVVGSALNSTSSYSGVYFDNLVMGNRWALRDKDNSESVVLQSDFSGATPGAQVYPTSEAAFGSSWEKMGGSVNKTTIVYVDETGPEGVPDGIVDAMKWTTPTEESLAKYPQTYPQININTDNNFSISMDLKMGADGIKGSQSLIWQDINRNLAPTEDDTERVQLDIISIGANGQIKYGGDVITTISKTEYTNIRVDIATAGPSAKSMVYFIYVNGVLAYANVRESQVYDSYAYIRSIRLYTQFGSTSNPRPYPIEHLKEDDLYMKNLVMKHTADYNKYGNNPIPFATNPKGFAVHQGITRYFDGNGGYATQDFFIGTTKYMVGTDGEILSKIVGELPERTLNDVRDEFATENVDLRLYQSFDNTGLLTDGATEYIYPKGTGGNDLMQGTIDYKNGGYLNYKNARQSFKLVREADGNVALLHHASTKQSSNNDTYIDILSGLPRTHYGAQGNGSHDLYLSIDVKMKGESIISAALFSPVLRFASGNMSPGLVFISAAGGIYVGNTGLSPDNGYVANYSADYSPEALVGYLSNKEYTRIAFSTDRLNNKYYVYINDVCVTPEGKTLFTEDIVSKFEEKDTDKKDGKFTVNTVPIHEIRTFVTSSHNDDRAHAGVYFDNIIYGARQPFSNTKTETSGYKSVSINDIDTGVTFTEGVTAGGVFDPYKLGIGIGQVAIGTWSDGSGTIQYVDENGDGKPDAIELHRDTTAGSTTSGQAYFQFSSGYTKGTNLSVSASIKAGQTGTYGMGNLIGIRHDLTLSDKVRYDSYIVNVKVNSSNKLIANTATAGDVVIADLSKTAYTHVKVDIVCNGVLPTAMFYIGTEGASGEIVYELKTSLPFSLKYAGVDGYGVTEFKPNMFRFYSVYTGTPAKVNEHDVRMNAFAFGRTNAYDNAATERISVFEATPTGMYGIGGIFRYYNGDGTFMTEDFTADGVKYLVGYNGSVTRESDGREFAPYAPYVDYDPTGTLILNSANGSAISGGCIGLDRNAVSYSAFLSDGTPVRLYHTFDNPGNPNTDHNSYAAQSIPEAKRTNASLVLSLDIMIDEMSWETVTSQDLFYFVGYNSAGSRADAGLLKLGKDGWIMDNDFKTPLIKLSKNEFTRLSIAITTPDGTGSNPATFDVYANGVLIKSYTAAKSILRIEEIRYPQSHRTDASFYIKDVYMYESAKPQQFYTMQNGTPVLTPDQNATPAKASDIKKGVVEENGVVRYYSDLGLPVLSGSVTIDGNTFTTDRYGKLSCNGDKHVQFNEDGVCICCGAKKDGITSLYGHTLSLDSDVKVTFVLDIDTAKAAGAKVQIGLERDFAEGGDAQKIVTKELSELTVKEIDGKNYYVVDFGVPAKDIAVNVMTRLVKADGSFGTEYVYSAKAYIDDVNSRPEGGDITAALKALVSALEVYGKNAAAVLADGPVADTIASADFSKVVDATGSKTGNTLRLHSFSLELKSNIKLRVYFSLTRSIAKIEDYTVKVNGEVRNVTATNNKYIYCIEETVTATELGDTFTFTVESADSSLTLSLSALYYAKMMNEQAATEAEKNLMKAIKLYYDAAIAYKESK